MAFPAAPARWIDPYPHYARLRSEDPVGWDDELQGWYVSRYSDVSKWLRDRRLTAARVAPMCAATPAPLAEAIRPLHRCLDLWMLFRPAGDHARLRAISNKAFTAEVIDRITPTVAATVDQLLDAWPDGAVVDVMATLAYPLPAMSIGAMFGLPSADLSGLAHAWETVAEAIGTGQLTPAAARCCRSVMDYLEAMLGRSDRATAGPFTNVLLGAEQRGALTREELLLNAVFFLLAGHDTTTNLVGNGILALLRNPHEWARLRDAPSLAPSAVEEFLRYDSPVQHVSRRTLEDVEIGGRMIKKQQRVWLSIGSANRDPDQFANPNIVDVGRRDNKHVAFIAGEYYCPGAPLSRLEGRLVLLGLLGRFRHLELVDETADWKHDATVRGLNTLRVRVRR